MSGLLADNVSTAEPIQNGHRPSLDAQKEGALLVDPALLALTSQNKAKMDTIAPARAGLVSAS